MNEKKALAELNKAWAHVEAARAALLDAHAFGGGAALDVTAAAEAYNLLGEIAEWLTDECERYDHTLARLAWAAGETEEPEAEAAEEPRREGLFGRFVRAFAAVVL